MATNHHHKSLCWGCGKRTDNLKKCSACHVAQYCGKECQTKNWYVHSGECVAYQATHPENTEENIAERLEDAIDNAADRGHITNDQLDRGEELIEILDPILTDWGDGSFDAATVAEKKEAIDLTIHLSHCIHDLTQEDVMKVKNMQFHKDLHPEDLLDALEKKIKHGVEVMEEIVDGGDSESYESNYIGGEEEDFDSESEEYIEGEIDDYDEIEIDSDFDEEDGPTLLALGHFETTLDNAHSVADDLWGAIGDLEKTGAPIDKDVIQRALDMVVHCSMAIETTEGLELVSGRLRRARRRRKRQRKGHKGQRRTRKRSQKGQRKTLKRGQKGQRKTQRKAQRGQGAAQRKAQKRQRRATRKAQKRQRKTRGAEKSRTRQAKRRRQRESRAARRRKKRERREVDKRRRRTERSRKKGEKQKKSELKKESKKGKKQGKGRKRKDKKSRRREDRGDRKKKRKGKRERKREKRKRRKEERRRGRKDEARERSSSRREKGKEHERSDRSSKGRTRGGRESRLHVPTAVYGAGGSGRYLAERGQERRMRKERERERKEQRTQREEENEERQQRLEDEDRERRQRLEDEDRERLQRHEKEDRERLQRREDEEGTLSDKSQGVGCKYDNADFDRKSYMDLLREERLSCKADIRDFLEQKF